MRWLFKAADGGKFVAIQYFETLIGSEVCNSGEEVLGFCGDKAEWLNGLLCVRTIDGWEGLHDTDMIYRAENGLFAVMTVEEFDARFEEVGPVPADWRNPTYGLCDESGPKGPEKG